MAAASPLKEDLTLNIRFFCSYNSTPHLTFACFIRLGIAFGYSVHFILPSLVFIYFNSIENWYIGEKGVWF